MQGTRINQHSIKRRIKIINEKIKTSKTTSTIKSLTYLWCQSYIARRQSRPVGFVIAPHGGNSFQQFAILLHELLNSGLSTKERQKYSLKMSIRHKTVRQRDTFIFYDQCLAGIHSPTHQRKKRK